MPGGWRIDSSTVPACSSSRGRICRSSILRRAGHRSANGGYILAGAEGDPDIVLIGTGSEVDLAVRRRRPLAEQGITALASSACRPGNCSTQQDDAYRERVLGRNRDAARRRSKRAPRIGWERYVGERGAVVGIDRFGASGPGGKVLEHFGFTPERCRGDRAAPPRSGRARSRTIVDRRGVIIQSYGGASWPTTASSSSI